MDNRDKAGKVYWDVCWSESKLPGLINPRKKGLLNYTNRKFHDLFLKLFAGKEGKPIKLLEIGCARSTWLPYFAKEFGFSVSGIDYSEVGCEQARQILSNLKIDNDIICSDFFDPPPHLFNSFDIVTSFGVLEHFADTKACVTSFSRFLKPDGIMFTLIPNMCGIVGVTQKIVDRKTFEIHVPLNKQDIEDAHISVGLQVIECKYFLPINFGVINANNIDKDLSLSFFFKKLFVKALTLASLCTHFVDEKLVKLPETFLLSPYILCIAQKRS